MQHQLIAFQKKFGSAARRTSDLRPRRHSMPREPNGGRGSRGNEKGRHATAMSTPSRKTGRLHMEATDAPPHARKEWSSLLTGHFLGIWIAGLLSGIHAH
jgi:hypothetical protein